MRRSARPIVKNFSVRPGSKPYRTLCSRLFPPYASFFRKMPISEKSCVFFCVLCGIRRFKFPFSVHHDRMRRRNIHKKRRDGKSLFAFFCFFRKKAVTRFGNTSACVGASNRGCLRILRGIFSPYSPFSILSVLSLSLCGHGIFQDEEGNRPRKACLRRTFGGGFLFKFFWLRSFAEMYCW